MHTRTYARAREHTHACTHTRPLARPQEKHYAFMEMRSVEEASNMTALDGVAWMGAHLKIR